MSNRNCPECTIIMKKENHNGVTIDKCISCEGVFLDFGEMKEIMENVSFNKVFDKVQKGDFTKDNQGKEILCSDCTSIMEEREYIYGSGNHINFCTQCKSIYLDKGELEQLKDFEISRISSREGKELLEKIEMKGYKISNDQKQYFENIEKERLEDTVIVGLLYGFISKLLNK